MDEQRPLPPFEVMTPERCAVTQSTTPCHEQAPAPSDADDGSGSMAIPSPRPLKAGDTNASTKTPAKASDGPIRVCLLTAAGFAG
jgi:hypothetical protein